MNAKLVLVGKSDKPTVVKVKKLPMTLGRGREADLTIAHPTVSRLHCELYEIDETLCVRDMGSLNGTFVGDVRVTEASLESGDELIVGSARFKLLIDESDATAEIPEIDAVEDMEDPSGSIIDAAEFEELDDEPLEPPEFIDVIDEALADTDQGAAVEQAPAEPKVARKPAKEKPAKEKKETKSPKPAAKANAADKKTEGAAGKKAGERQAKQEKQAQQKREEKEKPSSGELDFDEALKKDAKKTAPSASQLDFGQDKDASKDAPSVSKLDFGGGKDAKEKEGAPSASKLNFGQADEKKSVGDDDDLQEFLAGMD
jgi:pSer/pThr/pTyr-binding forkhead associated (FHA) protein